MRLSLFLFLHGAGERGNKIDSVKLHGIPKQIENGQTFPFITIAPQCPEGVWWNYSDYIYSLISLTKKIIQKYNVNPGRVYGTGLSMGGFGILEMAIQDPELFSAIVSICGGANINNLDRLSHLPIWLFHGENDEVIPVESSILIYKMLKNVNPHIHLTVYKELSHDSWTNTYENKEIYDWCLRFNKNP